MKVSDWRNLIRVACSVPDIVELNCLVFYSVQLEKWLGGTSEQILTDAFCEALPRDSFSVLLKWEQAGCTSDTA